MLNIILQNLASMRVLALTGSGQDNMKSYLCYVSLLATFIQGQNSRLEKNKGVGHHDRSLRVINLSMLLVEDSWVGVQ